jgi:hypothetical protein
MTQNALNELRKTAERYKKHGITLSQLVRIAETAPADISERAAIIGIRMSLAREYGETEYFTLDDVSEVTGETTAEVQNRINAMGIDTMQITSLIPGLFS